MEDLLTVVAVAWYIVCIVCKETNERWFWGKMEEIQKSESEFLLEFSNLILEGISLQMKEACFDLLSSL